MGGNSATWSPAKKILMLHSTVATILSLLLIFSPSYVPIYLQDKYGIYTGLLFLLGGLFCTAPDTPGVNSAVSGSILLSAVLFWYNNYTHIQSGITPPSIIVILGYLFGTGFAHLLLTPKPKKS